MYLKSSKEFLKSSEEVISMFLGLVIVIIMVGLIFNFVQKRKGNISLPGISTTNIQNNGSNADNGSVNNGSKKVYQVVYGDNLWKIAQKEYGDGNAWTRIALENKLSNPRILHVGQELVISKNEQSKIAQKQEPTQKLTNGEYTVVRGDSLWKIAVAQYGDGFKWTKIWETNKSIIGQNPGMIYKDMHLVIPKLNE